MNELFNNVVENKELFVPNIISKRQFEVIQKITNKEKLTRTEQNYYYGAIKKKLKALNTIKNKEETNTIYFYEPTIIKERIPIIKNILKQRKKIFISGSFLFSKEYNDIDVFAIAKKYKEEHDKKQNIHYIYLKEKDLSKPIFVSATKSCASNFLIPKIKPRIKKPRLNKTISVYQEAIINILEKQDLKICKEIIFEYYLHVENKILSSKELNKEYQGFLNNKTKIKYITLLFNKIIKTFNQNYVTRRLREQIEDLHEDIENITPNDHLKIYRDTYHSIINDKKRNRTNI